MPGILWAVLQSPLAIQPLFPEGSPHHITLQYGVDRKKWEHLIGLPLTVGAVAHCHNDRVQAIAVVLPTWVPCQNPHPHITVSWAAGVQPVEANVMLAGEHDWVSVAYPIHTTIEWLEWGEMPSTDRLCSVCRERKLRRDNKTGVCARCQPRIQKNAKYRKTRLTP